MSPLLIIFAAISLQNLSYHPPEIVSDSLLEGMRFHIPGCITPEPGLPDLPIKEVLVGIPQKGRVEIEVEPGEYGIRDEIDIAPVPKRFPDRTPIYERDQKVYGRDEFYPRRLVRIKEIGWLRNIRVAIIDISPIQYNPIKREVRVYRDIKYRIKTSHAPSQSFKKDHFDRLYKIMIVNYDECKNWRGIPSPPKVKTPFNKSRNWVKVKIRDQGAYKIEYKDLQTLGISPSLIDPKTFKIFNIGNFIPRESYPDSMIEVPIYVYGEGDGKFDKGDYILFYGHPVSYWDYEKERFISNPYTWYNYYWLSWEGERGKRFVKKEASSGEGIKINSSTSIFHLEQEGDNPGRGGNLWIWREFKSDNLSPLDTTFVLPHAESLLSATLAFYPTERDDYPLKFPEIEVSINSELFSTLHFFEEETGFCYPSPAKRTIKFYRESEEKVELLLRPLGRKTHPLYLDYIDFLYKQKFSLKDRNLLVFLDSSGVYEFEVKDVSSSPLILDITDYANPSIISDFELSKGILKFKVGVESTGLFYLTEEERFLKPLSLELRQPGNLLYSGFQPDYIIVSPDEFYQAALVLAQYRQQKGRKSIEVVKISQVYDDFGFGLEDPIAVKRLFSVKQPHYGLLTSDGNYDYREIRNEQNFTPVPPYEEGWSVDPNCAFWSDVTSYEAWYADWDGEGSTPDMALGRICVRNNRELRRFLDKLIGYESSPGGWMKRFILLGDDVWAGKPGEKHEDTVHIGNCEAVADAISHRFDLVKVYLTEYPYEVATKPKATEALKREWNRGASGLCYFGHGAGSLLTHEHVFTTDMVASLHNRNKLPIAFFGSCMVGRFDDTKYECIAEELVRSPTGGTIASMAASCGTSSPSNQNFAIALFRSLLSDTLNLGEAFYIAWPKETSTILFGDPEMEVQIPQEGGEIEIEPPYLQLGGETRVTADVDINSGRYGLSVYAPQYRRTYEWTYNNTPYSTQYILPGQEFHYNIGKIENDTIKARFFTPQELGSDSIVVPDGLYEKIRNSASISIAAWDSKKRYRLHKGSIPVESSGPQEDREGPRITLYADNRPIMEGDRLPERFTLIGKLSDPSGILSADINTTPKHNFLFYINTPDNAVYLYDYFRYHEGSDTSGEFSYPVNLPSLIDTIVVIAYDNLFNQTIKRVGVERYTSERLSIKNPLVYPTPIKRDGYFTFHLNKPAWVKIKIYTVSGRSIKVFEERRCSYGYNQIYWEGKDEDGDYPANGVYLYKISAHTRVDSKEYQEFLGKFIILK